MRWFLLFAFVYATVWGTTQVRAAPLRAYENTRFGFTLQYPDGIFSDPKVSESGDGASI
jgi:hypothetical protein